MGVVSLEMEYRCLVVGDLLPEAFMLQSFYVVSANQ